MKQLFGTVRPHPQGGMEDIRRLPSPSSRRIPRPAPEISGHPRHRFLGGRPRNHLEADSGGGRPIREEGR